MKEKLSHAAGYLLFFVLISTSSCKKIIDEIVKHPNGAAGDCRITRITSMLTPYGRMDTAVFSYDTKGNPVSIKHSISDFLLENQYYSPDQYFGYYPDGRLAAYLSDSYQYEPVGEHNQYALFWQKFTYVGANVIIDSVFAYANGNLANSFTPLNPETSLSVVQKFELDSYGRISKIDVLDSAGNVSNSYPYNYDSNGNLVLPGVTYNTTKHNLRQTNKVWRLITYDYSLNSSVNEVLTYNSKKLPETLNKMPGFIFSLGNSAEQIFDNIKVSYQCK